MHRVVSKLQAQSLTQAIDSVRSGSIVVIADFAMNYTHEHLTEFGEEHWAAWQTTVLPVVVYWRGENSVVWAEDYVGLSDDLNHGNASVQHVLEDVVQFYRQRLLTKTGEHLRAVSFWSDGCAGQFKNCSIFAWLSQLGRWSLTNMPSSRPSRVITGVTLNDEVTLNNPNPEQPEP